MTDEDINLLHSRNNNNHQEESNLDTSRNTSDNTNKLPKQPSVVKRRSSLAEMNVAKTSKNLFYAFVLLQFFVPVLAYLLQEHIKYNKEESKNVNEKITFLSFIRFFIINLIDV